MMRFLERLFNHCQDCGVRIKWNDHTFWGQRYMPVVCMDCVEADHAEHARWRDEMLGGRP